LIWVFLHGRQGAAGRLLLCGRLLSGRALRGRLLHRGLLSRSLLRGRRLVARIGARGEDGCARILLREGGGRDEGQAQREKQRSGLAFDSRGAGNVSLHGLYQERRGMRRLSS